MVTLEGEVLRARATRIRLVLTDNDGVLTDAGVFYSENGEMLKRYSVRDGMGVERLRDAKIETAIITREAGNLVARRAEKLGVHIYAGVRDKAASYGRILEDSDVSDGEVAFIGDDVNDLGLLRVIAAHGLAGAPSDAMRSVRDAVHFVSEERGGHGAFRDFAEWILQLREGAAQ